MTHKTIADQLLALINLCTVKRVWEDILTMLLACCLEISQELVCMTLESYTEFQSHSSCYEKFFTSVLCSALKDKLWQSIELIEYAGMDWVLISLTSIQALNESDDNWTEYVNEEQLSLEVEVQLKELVRDLLYAQFFSWSSYSRWKQNIKGTQ